jgi:hypothetical protein
VIEPENRFNRRDETSAYMPSSATVEVAHLLSTDKTIV